MLVSSSAPHTATVLLLLYIQLSLPLYRKCITLVDISSTMTSESITYKDANADKFPEPVEPLGMTRDSISKSTIDSKDPYGIPS